METNKHKRRSELIMKKFYLEESIIGIESTPVSEFISEVNLKGYADEINQLNLKINSIEDRLLNDKEFVSSFENN
jgi:hypothetical protein